MPRPIVLVLVGTKAAGNLGAVCRIAQAFDLAGVRLVEPQVAPTDEDARRLGRGAHDMLDAVRAYGTLAEAVADCARTAATTARARHWTRPVRHPAEALGLAEARDDAPFAVVFGPEDHGLRNEDLAACDEILSVPLPGDTGATLSLPASCAIICHELAREREDSPAARGPRAAWGGSPVGAAELETLIDQMTATLDEIGLRAVPDPVRFRGTLRDFLARARPTEGDHRILRYVFAQVGKWRRRLEGEVRREGGARTEFPLTNDAETGRNAEEDARERNP